MGEKGDIPFLLMFCFWDPRGYTFRSSIVTFCLFRQFVCLKCTIFRPEMRLGLEIRRRLCYNGSKTPCPFWEGPRKEGKEMYLAICDDQGEDLAALTELLDRWQAERGVHFRTCVFHSADELRSAARHEHFTLYFLDVMMPGISGMAAAQEIRCFDQAADIVFLTSAPGFAYASYGVKALEYLLKPVKAQTLFPILDRLSLRDQRPQEGLTLKSGSTLIRVPFSLLTYVEVNGKHLYFNLNGGQVYEVAGTLKDFEDQLLARPEFRRVHRSYIVNLLQVQQLSPGGIRTFSGKELPVSRLLYSHLQKDYMRLMFAASKE